MEGFNLPIEKKRPTDEPEMILDGKEKTSVAEVSVKGMFDGKMEAEGVIRKVMENPYFLDLSQRIN